MEVMLVDSVKIEASTRRKTPDGFLHVMGKVTRVGVNMYDSAAVGIPLQPPQRIGIFRSADSIFHSDTLKDVIGKPLTLDHPGSGRDTRELQSVCRRPYDR